MDVQALFGPRFEVDRLSDHLLGGVVQDHVVRGGRDLIERWLPVAAWYDERHDAGLDPHQKIARGRVQATVSGSLRGGWHFSGVNFASQDPLSLASHPGLIRAAKAAAEAYGVHTAGSSSLMGRTELTVRLERTLESFLRYREVTLFPTGWAAGYGIVKMLAQPGDHILIDALAHACLQDGATASGASVHRFAHLSTEEVRRGIERIRSDAPEAGILVVTEALFSPDSDSPRIADLQAICTREGTTLLVDCAHDLGCMGKSGLGVLELQDMVGKVDVLMGSFSKSFASTGGFVASQRKGLRTAIRACCGPQTSANAMTPLQAAVILEALQIVAGDEGAARRARLAENVAHLRGRLRDARFELVGAPSPIVPIAIGDSATARLMTRHMIRNGAIVNLVEHVRAEHDAAFWKLHVMADHEAAHVDAFVDCAIDARQHGAVWHPYQFMRRKQGRGSRRRASFR